MCSGAGSQVQTETDSLKDGLSAVVVVYEYFRLVCFFILWWHVIILLLSIVNMLHIVPLNIITITVIQEDCWKISFPLLV